jgi:NADPH:quinone reductase-like Zn-dependent oxidoreductase
VGQATWEHSMKSLRRGGRLVTCGATTGPSGSIDIRHLFTRQISLIGSYMGTKGELLQAAELFFEGRFKPVVDGSYPLEAAVEAQRRLEDQARFGKIVLEV